MQNSKINLTGVLLLCAIALSGCLTEPENVRGGVGGAIAIGGSSGAAAPPASQPMAPAPAEILPSEAVGDDFYDEEGTADVTHPPGQEIETPDEVILLGEWFEDLTVGEWSAKEDRCNLRARKLSRERNLDVAVSSVEIMGLDQWGNKYIRCYLKTEPNNAQLELFDDSNNW